MFILLGALGGCTSRGGDAPAIDAREKTPASVEIGERDAPVAVQSARAVHDYRAPRSMSLCGEKLDLGKRGVFERFEYEFVRVVHQPAQIELWRRRAQRYFPLIEQRLRQAGLPEDLKYLAVAESDLRPFIESPAGALGIWQFMPATARQFGLTVNQRVDQRQLPEPLLGAGERYLKSLYQKFGSWSLAMAAYNCGDGRIAKAISSQGTKDYYQLDLPRETERYVYRIAAVKAVLEDTGGYGVKGHIPYGFYRPVEYVEVPVNFGGIGWPELAERLGCDYKSLRALNPHIMAGSLSGEYSLRVPKGTEARLR